MKRYFGILPESQNTFSLEVNHVGHTLTHTDCQVCQTANLDSRRMEMACFFLGVPVWVQTGSAEPHRQNRVPNAVDLPYDRFWIDSEPVRWSFNDRKNLNCNHKPCGLTMSGWPPLTCNICRFVDVAGFELLHSNYWDSLIRRIWVDDAGRLVEVTGAAWTMTLAGDCVAFIWGGTVYMV